MNNPARNVIYGKIKQAGNITDVDLMNVWRKDIAYSTHYRKSCDALSVYRAVGWILKPFVCRSRS